LNMLGPLFVKQFDLKTMKLRSTPGNSGVKKYQ